MKENIFTIIGGQIPLGQGFLANGYFITAAHVLRDNDKYLVTIKGETKDLAKEVPVYIGSGNIYDPNCFDLAVFKFENVEGGLPVLDYTPKKDEVLESCCQRIVKDDDWGKPVYELDVKLAFALGEEEGHYFHCKCFRKKGSSGSPLLKDNHVIGFMHGGKVVKELIEQGRLSEEEKQAFNLKDEDIICSFFKIGAFKTLIEKIKNN